MHARPGLMAGAVPNFLLLAIFLPIHTDRAFGQKVPGATRGPSVTPSFIIGNENDYAGIDRCRSCHKPEYREYQKTAHSKVTVPGKSYISGCEVCHGPGKAHADAIEAAEGDEGKTQRALTEHPIFSFSVNQKITAALQQFPIFHFRSNSKENTARCLFGHISSKQQDFFQHSTHVAHGMSCDQCHTSHLVTEVKDQSKGPLYSPRAHDSENHPGLELNVQSRGSRVRWSHRFGFLSQHPV